MDVHIEASFKAAGESDVGKELARVYKQVCDEVERVRAEEAKLLILPGFPRPAPKIDIVYPREAKK